MIGNLLYNTVEDRPCGIIDSIISEDETMYLSVFCIQDASLSFLIRKDIVFKSSIWKIIKGANNEKV